MSEKKKTMKNIQINKKAAVVVVASLALLYVIGILYFSFHFLPGSCILGVKVGGKTVKAAKVKVEEEWKSYVLTLKLREDQTQELKGSDIKLEINLDDEAIREARNEQKARLWPVAVFLREDFFLEHSIGYDEELLLSRLEKMDFLQKENMTPPVNAKIVYVDGSFTVESEKKGTVVKEDRLLNVLRESLYQGAEMIDLEEADCYENPTFFAEDEAVIKALARVEALRSVEITYDFRYTTEIVDKALIDRWIVVDETMEVGLDYEKVLDYIEELAAKYDTYATLRDFKNSYGQTIQMQYGGYGWKISQTKETRALMEAIEAGENGMREPIYLYTAYVRKEGNRDWDDTYAEVSISGQHMWFYKDGKCVLSTDVVTGDVVRPGRTTPTGVYGVLYKIRDQVLVGEDYESGVKYWMPFDTNVGFHDASWRKPEEFGGQTYKGNGSHGCVNMPEDAARRLYELIEPGCPVFVY